MTEEVENPERRWRELLENARRLLRLRENEEARRLVGEGIAYTETVWGSEDEHLIPLLRLMAESLWRGHEPLEANNEAELAYLRRALAISRKRLTSRGLEVARLAGELGNHLIIAGELDEGCSLMTECLDIARANGTEEGFAMYLPVLAHARMAQGRAAEALPLLERAVVVFDTSLTVRTTMRCELARCLVVLGRRDEALMQLEVALHELDADRLHGRNADLMSLVMDLADWAKAYDGSSHE
ncbi:MAG: hypothetical protein JST00_20410 [Deltaproteobacteria bacterium]|nr:hypothetical protein [Deltaproteobacteria bacterium]